MKWQLRHLQSCGSTNDEAREWAEAGAPHGSVVRSDEQRAGRGRQGRSWLSEPAQNLTFSCVLRPDLEPRRVPPITIAAGLAICEAVCDLGAAAQVKWPNDIWIGERKLAGVLTEMSCSAQKVHYVIVGVGLNVLQREFPEGLAATSLACELPAVPEIDEVFERVLLRLGEWVKRYESAGVAALKERFAENSLLGAARRIKARVGIEILEGKTLGLDDEGNLLLQTDSGSVHRVVAGDVEIV
jgi:BirA family biotin operon repressor/biotin-[acetyl-CoA-carboxylase] ligase